MGHSSEPDIPIKNEKLELSFTLLKLDAVTQSHNIDLEPLGLCNSETLKQ